MKFEQVLFEDIGKNKLLRDKNIQSDEDYLTNKYNHRRIDEVSKFMVKFTNCNLQDKIQAEDMNKFNEVYSTYSKLLTIIKNKFMSEDKFKNNIEGHMKEINNYLTKTYLRSDIMRYKCKFRGIDDLLNSKLTLLRKSDFDNELEIPKHMKGHPVWKKATDDLENVKQKVTPQYKLDSIVRSLTTISRAYLLLSNFGDEVTADDILQFTCYIILKSSLTSIYSYIRYIKAFNYISEKDRQGMEQFCFQNMEIACEYMMQINPKAEKKKLFELLNQVSKSNRNQKKMPDKTASENMFTLEFG